MKLAKFRVGNTYQTREGKLVTFMGVKQEGTSYETMYDQDNIHRYTSRDFGRVTGTDHNAPDPRNVLPLYILDDHEREVLKPLVRE